MKILIQLLVALTGGAVLSTQPVAGMDAPLDFFEKRIRPVLTEHCYDCHSATSKNLKGGLRVDNRSGLLSGGETGPAVIPGNPEKSLLWIALSHGNKDLTMPPKKPKLPPAILADIEQWIRMGAPWPSTDVAVHVSNVAGFDLGERKRRLDWIWKTPSKPTFPTVRDGSWGKGAIDSFLLNRLEKEGIRPAPQADPSVWLRRVHFAIAGLPPSVGQLEAFIKDPSDAARERVVSELLSSPRFGERWARHWLDLMRYAESRGHESDFIIPNAYEYRDYVIRALNADVPYDDFVREHLAGDLLPKPRRHPEQGFNESVLATGWAFLGEEIHAPVDTRLDETERIDNRIDVLTKSFLSLTVSCARCHDHKFDAITQRDYYAMAGFFVSSGQRQARFESLDTERTASQRLKALRAKWRPALAERLRDAQLPIVDRLKDYLVGASDVAKARTNALPAAGKPITAADLTGPESVRLQEVATSGNLDRAVLAQWTLALLNAASNRTDVLHPLASLALFQTVPPGTKANPAWDDVGVPPGSRRILDFGNLLPDQWRVDGVGFGTSPAQVGELRLAKGFSNAPPTFRVVSRPSALADQDWFQLGLKSGVEQEPVMYGGWVRDGAILRSPKIELKGGKVHYLVKGAGKVLAVVDSQRLVTGPIHTGLVREWGAGDSWHWVSHNLADYAGHRVALEFSPGSGFETAIALVIESDETPAAPWSASSHFSELLRKRAVSNSIPMGIAAQVYQDQLSSAVRAPALPSGKDSGETLELADWLACHPELLSGKPGVWPEQLSQVIKIYAEERDPILQPVQWKSKTAPAMWDGDGVDEFLLVRGKHHTPKGTVPRRFLEALSGTDAIQAPQTSGRFELASVITQPDNPLLARVFVNRVWHHLFGRGIVPSVDNFGWLGQRPSHPELLDYLAHSFIHEDHWSLKKLVKRMVLSSAYGMSSKPLSAEVETRDPENVLLHRMNLRRLEAEAIRDAILSVSGRLTESMYGVSVPLHESQFVEARGLRSERGPLDGNGRRSLYVSARRNFLPMMMTAFDMPIPFTTVGRRNLSNVPGQMLFLMNDPFVHQQAEVWAQRNEREGSQTSEDARIQKLFLAAFSRPSTTKELASCRETLRVARGLAEAGSSTTDEWTELCHALFGAKEFIFIQ